MIPQLERRITIPEDVYVALGEIAAKERQKIKDPLFKKMITEKSLAQHLSGSPRVGRRYARRLELRG